MEQVAAIVQAESDFVDREIVTFKWLRPCSGARERWFAAAKVAQALSGGKYCSGDLVTVGFNEHADKILMAAPGRSRIVAKVELGPDDARDVIARLGWRVLQVDVPEDADGQYHQTPYQLILDGIAESTEAPR